MPGGFQKGNKIGHRFKKGEVSNPLGSAGIPHTIKTKWQSVESGLTKAGIVLDIVNQELDNPDVQHGIRESVRRLANSTDPAVIIRFLSFVLTFAPKVKHEAFMSEFTGNREALARAVSKLKPSTGSGFQDDRPEITGDNMPYSSQVVDIGLDS